jgi:DNA-binding transcriptional MerR regulator
VLVIIQNAVPGMSMRETYVMVHDAAEILGVAPNTIRAWGAAGKIPEYRHPLNGYRLYKRSDLNQVIERLERSAAKVKSSNRQKAQTMAATSGRR